MQQMIFFNKLWCSLGQFWPNLLDFLLGWVYFLQPPDKICSITGTFKAAPTQMTL